VAAQSIGAALPDHSLGEKQTASNGLSNQTYRTPEEMIVRLELKPGAALRSE